MTDDERINWLEQQTKISRTGISFDWIPSVEGEPSGYRFMHYHFVGNAGKSLRDTIDDAIRRSKS